MGGQDKKATGCRNSARLIHPHGLEHSRGEHLKRTTGMNTNGWKLPSTGTARLIIAACLLLMTVGCSTFQANDLPPDELQSEIASGNLIQRGDHLAITTDQGRRYELEITRISEDSVWGEEAFQKHETVINENADVSVQTIETRPVEIPIVEIVAIDKREATPVGAAGAAAGAVGLLYFIWVLAPALLVGAIVGF